MGVIVMPGRAVGGLAGEGNWGNVPEMGMEGLYSAALLAYVKPFLFLEAARELRANKRLGLCIFLKRSHSSATRCGGCDERVRKSE